VRGMDAAPGAHREVFTASRGQAGRPPTPDPTNAHERERPRAARR